VSLLLEMLGDRFGLEGFALHLHDTYRRALANALAGLLLGVEEFDASAGGLGGCPFAPGAKGNVATEDLVDFLEGMGIATGIDAAKVRTAAEAVWLFFGATLAFPQRSKKRWGTRADLRRRVFLCGPVPPPSTPSPGKTLDRGPGLEGSATSVAFSFWAGPSPSIHARGTPRPASPGSATPRT
jgi:hypothetical protein